MTQFSSISNWMWSETGESTRPGAMTKPPCVFMDQPWPGHREWCTCNLHSSNLNQTLTITKEK